MNETPVFPAETRLLTIPSLVPKGFVHGVEFLNDTVTPMDFVVKIFMGHLGMTESEAVRNMLDIHINGGILVPLPTLNRAEEVAQAITAESGKCGYPFVCRAVDIQQTVQPLDVLEGEPQSN